MNGMPSLSRAQCDLAAFEWNGPFYIFFTDLMACSRLHKGATNACESLQLKYRRKYPETQATRKAATHRDNTLPPSARNNWLCELQWTRASFNRLPGWPNADPASHFPLSFFIFCLGAPHRRLTKRVTSHFSAPPCNARPDKLQCCHHAATKITSRTPMRQLDEVTTEIMKRGRVKKNPASTKQRNPPPLLSRYAQAGAADLSAPITTCARDFFFFFAVLQIRAFAVRRLGGFFFFFFVFVRFCVLARNSWKQCVTAWQWIQAKNYATVPHLGQINKKYRA